MDDKDKRILIIVGVTILALAFAFLSTVTGLCWKYFKSMFTGQVYYTEQEYNEKFQNEKENYDNLLKQYQENLTNAINDKDNAENQLETEQSNNKRLQTQVSNLEKDKTSYEARVKELETQYEESGKTNTALFEQITELNHKIVEANSKFVELTIQFQNSQNVITTLTNKIEKLNKTINSYQEFISALDFEDKVVCTFNFDGEIINLQLIVKGTHASIENPSTEYVVLNHWKVGEQQVELSSYVVNENTTFTADVTYKYEVKFMVDSSPTKTEIVTSGNYATAPEENPEKQDYEFKGWSVNGVDVIDVSSYAITQHTIFIAVFEKVVKTLQDYSWSEIDIISQSGHVEEYFKIGDEKDITITYGPEDIETLTVVIADFNHDNHVVFSLKYLMKKIDYKPIDFYDGKTQKVVDSILPSIFLNLDVDLQSVIYDKKLHLFKRTDVVKESYDREDLRFEYFKTNSLGFESDNGNGLVADCFGVEDYSSAYGNTGAGFIRQNGDFDYYDDYTPSSVGLKFYFCI